MFKKIVFATDASPACDVAAKTAFELSEKYGSKLIMVHVDANVSRESCPFVPDTPAMESARFGPEHVAMVKKGMKRKYGALIKKNKASEYEDPEYRVLEGDTAEKILEFALKIKAD